MQTAETATDLATAKPAAAKPYNTELHARFVKAKDAHGEDWSYARLASMLGGKGFSTSALSKYYSGKPEGNVEKLEKQIGALLTNDELRQQAPPEQGQLFETPVARQLLNVCELASKHRFIRAGIGRPGIGKTRATELYLQNNPTALSIELNMVTGLGTPKTLERQFFQHIVVLDYDRRTEKPGEYLIKHFSGMNRMIILDNAHLLTRLGLEWVLGFHDATQCPVVLIGNNELKTTLEQVQRAPSRIGAPVEFTLDPKRGTGCALKSSRDVAAHYLKLNWPAAAQSLTGAATEIVESIGCVRALAHVVAIARDWQNTRKLNATEAFTAAALKQVGIVKK